MRRSFHLNFIIKSIFDESEMTTGKKLWKSFLINSLIVIVRRKVCCLLIGINFYLTAAWKRQHIREEESRKTCLSDLSRVGHEVSAENQRNGFKIDASTDQKRAGDGASDFNRFVKLGRKKAFSWRAFSWKSFRFNFKCFGIIPQQDCSEARKVKYFSIISNEASSSQSVVCIHRLVCSCFVVRSSRNWAL